MSDDSREHELLQTIESAQAELARLRQSREQAKAPPEPRGVAGRPLRSQVLDCLDELGLPAFNREVAQYLLGVKGERIEAARFGSLRAQEMKAYDGPRPRSVYIAYGLTGRAEAIKRYVCRSDWPLEERVVAPTTGRVQHLRMTQRLCTIAYKAEHGAPVADLDVLRFLAADHARDLPGVQFRRGTFDFKAWADLAAELVAAVIDRDRDERRQLAQRIQIMVPERMQIFGSDKQVDPEPRLHTPITSDSLA
ncbi:MAG: hypothetical protein IAI50_19125 [Candidatus Eremiobacteraeota bacterium]|nr:hypothetical protein [Candidatus Eremiobacteraeota bacterium]